MLGRRIAARWLLASLFIVGPVAGQPASAADRSAARLLGQEGVALYQKGEYDQALDRLTRAEALVPAPSLSLWAARSLVELGRLIEANERYLAATRIRIEQQGLDEARLQVQRQAQADATKERAALLPRIPKLTIELRGANATAKILVDGRELPAALIGVAHPVDPGTHRVILGDQALELTLQEGESKAVTLVAPHAAEPPGPGAVASPPRSAAKPPSAFSVGAARADDGRPSSVPAYLALGVGGAGFVLAGVTGFIALQKKSDLDDACPDEQCPPELHGEVDSYERMKTLSTIGFAVGVIGAASGVVLLLSQSDDSAVHARLGLGSVAVGGRF
ncbi:MAG: hypothetical protein KC766_06415 [Myxococcales bacterium]|nr:hypothetical protein [Myxococcales bacterium]